MATKAFYRAKPDHVRPNRDIYQRGLRALLRNVPIGRGRPYELPATDSDRKRLPNWKEDPWTLSIVEVMKNNRPYGPGIFRDATTIREVTEPYEKYLKKFLTRHPQITWKLPKNSFDIAEWAPIKFAKRWAEVVKKEKLSDDDAYKVVVNEGGGGGDWRGLWETLEHDRVKNIIKLQASYGSSSKSQGISLLEAYREAKLKDTIYGKVSGVPNTRRVDELLDKTTLQAARRAANKDLIDLGTFLKVRQLRAARSAQLKATEFFRNKSG